MVASCIYLHIVIICDYIYALTVNLVFQIKIIPIKKHSSKTFSLFTLKQNYFMHNLKNVEITYVQCMASSSWLLIWLKIVSNKPYAVVLEDIYHFYCAVRSAVVKEILQCERELDNVKDHYAVNMHRTIIRHLTTNFTLIRTLFCRDWWL